MRLIVWLLFVSACGVPADGAAPDLERIGPLDTPVVDVPSADMRVADDVWLASRLSAIDAPLPTTEELAQQFSDPASTLAATAADPSVDYRVRMSATMLLGRYGTDPRVPEWVLQLAKDPAGQAGIQTAALNAAGRFPAAIRHPLASELAHLQDHEDIAVRVAFERNMLKD